jgi:hypothetical protein
MKTNNRPKTITRSPRHGLIGALQLVDAAAYLGISKLTLKRLCYRNLVHPNRVTGRLLFSIVELDRFLADPGTCGSTRRGSDDSPLQHLKR